MVSERLPPRTYLLAVTVKAEFAEDTVPVATEPSIEGMVLVKYATPEAAISDVVAIELPPLPEPQSALATENKPLLFT